MPAPRRPRTSPLRDEQLEAWRSFLRAHDHLLRTLDADLREGHDLTISEYDVLVQLAQAEGRRKRMRDLRWPPCSARAG